MLTPTDRQDRPTQFLVHSWAAQTLPFVAIRLNPSSCREALVDDRTRRAFERHFARRRLAPPPPEHGPGTELKSLLAAFGIAPAGNCGCMFYAHTMNREGIAWSRSNLDYIAGHMVAEAQQRGWLLPKRFMGAGAKVLVRLAILRSVRKQLSAQTVHAHIPDPQTAPR